MKKIVFLLILFLVPSLAFSVVMDSITCYYGRYSASDDIFFTNEDNIYNQASGSNSRYVANMGTYTLIVHRDEAGNTNNPLASNGIYDEGAFIRSLYFRNYTGNNTGIIKNDNLGLSTQVHLEAILHYNNYYYAPVDISRNSPINSEDGDTLTNILPSYFQTCTNAQAIRCPGSYHDHTIADVCDVIFYLVADNTNSASLIGKSFFISQESNFASIFSICVCHNYNPADFAGSLIPTANVGGDLALFPSSYLGIPLFYGESINTATDINYLVSINPLTTSQRLSDPTLPWNIAQLQAYIYGSGVNDEQSYSVQLTFTSNYSTNSNSFRMFHFSNNMVNYDHYVEYQLTFKNTPITYGVPYTWSDLSGGLNNSSLNVGLLTITGINRVNTNLGGFYKDTIIITISNPN